MLSHHRCAHWEEKRDHPWDLLLCWWTKVNNPLHLSAQGSTLAPWCTASAQILASNKRTRTTPRPQGLHRSSKLNLRAFYFICMGLENRAFKFLNCMAVLRFVHCSPPCPFQSMNPNQGILAVSPTFPFLFLLPSQMTQSDYRGQYNLTIHIQPLCIRYMPH